jgi:hypothetical protein
VCVHDAVGLWRACMQAALVGWRWWHAYTRVWGVRVCVTGRRHGSWPAHAMYTSLSVCRRCCADFFNCCYGGRFCPMWCLRRSPRFNAARVTH